MRAYSLVPQSVIHVAALAAVGMLASHAASAATYLDFAWEGQVAGFTVEGTFSYDETDLPTDGVIRKDDLLSFDVSFYDPDDNLLRTYADNHLSYAGFNFNYDTATRMILQDGAYFEDNGIDIGDYTPTSSTSATGLNFWSKPAPTAVPHVHVNDWANEFGFGRGFGGHQDVAFFDFTTQQLVDSGRVGPDYASDPNFPLGAYGARMAITTPVPLPSTLALMAGSIGLFGWVKRKS